MPRYNHIFSKRTPKARTIKQLLDLDNLEEMSYEEKRKFARYTNRQAKKFAQFPDMKNFLTDENNPDPFDAFEKLMAQKEFLNWKSIEREVDRNAEEHKELKGLIDDDKWTILRRLAAIDPRINVDRAYASETLKEIEDMIEQSKEKKYIDMDYITNDLMIRYMEIGHFNKTWDDELHGFTEYNTSTESTKLYANPGFHGVKKAEARYQRERKRDLSGYAPMWQSPFFFDESN